MKLFGKFKKRKPDKIKAGRALAVVASVPADEILPQVAVATETTGSSKPGQQQPENKLEGNKKRDKKNTKDVNGINAESNRSGTVATAVVVATPTRQQQQSSNSATIAVATEKKKKKTKDGKKPRTKRKKAEEATTKKIQSVTAAVAAQETSEKLPSATGASTKEAGETKATNGNISNMETSLAQKAAAPAKKALVSKKRDTSNKEPPKNKTVKEEHLDAAIQEKKKGAQDPPPESYTLKVADTKNKQAANGKEKRGNVPFRKGIMGAKSPREGKADVKGHPRQNKKKPVVNPASSPTSPSASSKNRTLSSGSGVNNKKKPVINTASSPISKNATLSSGSGVNNKKKPVINTASSPISPSASPKTTTFSSGSGVDVGSPRSQNTRKVNNCKKKKTSKVSASAITPKDVTPASKQERSSPVTSSTPTTPKVKFGDITEKVAKTVIDEVDETGVVDGGMLPTIISGAIGAMPERGRTLWETLSVCCAPLSLDDPSVTVSATVTNVDVVVMDDETKVDDASDSGGGDGGRGAGESSDWGPCFSCGGGAGNGAGARNKREVNDEQTANSILAHDDTTSDHDSSSNDETCTNDDDNDTADDTANDTANDTATYYVDDATTMDGCSNTVEDSTDTYADTYASTVDESTVHERDTDSHFGDSIGRDYDQPSSYLSSSTSTYRTATYTNEPSSSGCDSSRTRSCRSGGTGNNAKGISPRTFDKILAKTNNRQMRTPDAGVAAQQLPSSSPRMEPRPPAAQQLPSSSARMEPRPPHEEPKGVKSVDDASLIHQGDQPMPRAATTDATIEKQQWFKPKSAAVEDGNNTSAKLLDSPKTGQEEDREDEVCFPEVSFETETRDDVTSDVISVLTDALMLEAQLLLNEDDANNPPMPPLLSSMI